MTTKAGRKRKSRPGGERRSVVRLLSWTHEVSRIEDGQNVVGHYPRSFWRWKRFILPGGMANLLAVPKAHL